MLNRIKRHLKDLKDWVTKPMNREISYEESLGDVKEQLSRPADVDIGKTCVGLMGLGVWYSSNGALRVMQGDQSGWTEIARGYRAAFLENELKVLAYDHNPRRSKHSSVLASEAAICVADGMMFDDPRLHGWLDGKFSQRLDDGGIIPEKREPAVECIRVLYEVYCEHGIDSLSLSESTLGLYMDVFRCWDSEEALGMVIDALCDYHLSQSDEDSRGNRGVFTSQPFNILPVEIHALRTVRKKLGLITPQGSHELMAFPLGTLPAHVVIPEDWVLDSLEQWMMSLKSQFVNTDL